MAAAKKPAPEARRLVTFVHVGDSVYGPGDEVPAEVEALITNPAAWAPAPDAVVGDVDPSGEVA
jgi:hypothetical protein